VTDSTQVQRVRERAYALWERGGRPDGCDRQHWLQAEAELGREPQGLLESTSAAVAAAPGADERTSSGEATTAKGTQKRRAGSESERKRRKKR
jgi:hypothetical protein